MEMLTRAAQEHTLYIPDLPVTGDTLFTGEWYRANYARLQAACEMLADEGSKSLFCGILQYKLSGSIDILNDAYTAYSEERAALDVPSIHSYIDCGAYTGDTLRELIENGAPLTQAICIEPDKRTYRRLLKYTDTLPDGLVQTIPAAVWSENTVGVFSGSGNRNSSLVGASYEHREERVNLVTVDALCEGRRVDFVKYDVEGAEREALLGTRETIARFSPRLLVSLYHRTEDLFDLIFLVRELYPDASLRLFRRPCYPAWEIALVASAPASAKI
jgi:FkbM family methyltransferase